MMDILKFIFNLLDYGILMQALNFLVFENF